MFASPPTKPMKIAYITSEFPVLSETFIGTQMRAMKSLGHEVLPIAFKRPDKTYQKRDLVLAARTVYMCDEPKFPSAAGMMLSPGTSHLALSFARQQTQLPTRSLLYHGWRLAGVLRRHRVDHVHAQFAWGALAHAIVAARFAGITVSFVGHGADIYKTPQDLPLKLAHVDCAFATCSAMAEHFRELTPNVRAKRIAMGIELEHLPQPDLSPRDTQGFLFVGRLVEKKGISLILEALRQMDDARRPHIDIVGGGPLEHRLRAQIAEYGLGAKVNMLGSRPSEWIFENLPRYRAVIVPSVPATDGDRDTGPLIAKEAMALGVPVIASDFMGLAEIVDAQCGISVPTSSSEALAAALLEASSWNAERRLQLARAARRKVEESFSAKIQAARIADAIVAI